MVQSYTPDPTPSSSSDDVWPPPSAPEVYQTSFQRFSRKFREEPLVPVGILATVVALGAATAALQKGNRTQFNKFLRYRVAAQGVTVIAALGGSVYYGKERKDARAADRAAKGLPEKV